MPGETGVMWVGNWGVKIRLCVKQKCMKVNERQYWFQNSSYVKYQFAILAWLAHIIPSAKEMPNWSSCWLINGSLSDGAVNYFYFLYIFSPISHLSPSKSPQSWEVLEHTLMNESKKSRLMAPVVSGLTADKHTHTHTHSRFSLLL